MIYILGLLRYITDKNGIRNKQYSHEMIITTISLCLGFNFIKKLKNQSVSEICIHIQGTYSWGSEIKLNYHT